MVYTVTSAITQVMQDSNGSKRALAFDKEIQPSVGIGGVSVSPLSQGSLSSHRGREYAIWYRVINSTSAIDDVERQGCWKLLLGEVSKRILGLRKMSQSTKKKKHHEICM